MKKFGWYDPVETRHALSLPHALSLRRTIFILLLIISFWAAAPAGARVYLDITSADLRKLPMALPPFREKGSSSVTQRGREMALLLGRALTFHGFITILPPESYPKDDDGDWQGAGADFVVLGSYKEGADGITLELRLIDTHNNHMLLGKRYRAAAKFYEKVLLKFCDEAIFNLSGVRGISNSEIAFVSDRDGHKEVYVADVLGEHIRQITHHRSITVSPRFSPDGRKLVYTSYHRGNPNLYLTDLSQGKTTRAISWHKGLNVAPAWSPDGKTLLTTLSKDGNPDLYLISLKGRVLKRVTMDNGINVSASWSPDGRHFAFVSDRTGVPQIYVGDIVTKSSRRLTYSGMENTTPCWSPNGDLIAYTGKDGASHHIYVINADGGEPRQLTHYWGNYESPSWSPDGKQLVISRTRNDRQELCAIFLKGQGVRPLFKVKGNQLFPQWSGRLDYNIK